MSKLGPGSPSLETQVEVTPVALPATPPISKVEGEGSSSCLNLIVLSGLLGVVGGFVAKTRGLAG